MNSLVVGIFGLGSLWIREKNDGETGFGSTGFDAPEEEGLRGSEREGRKKGAFSGALGGSTGLLRWEMVSR